MQNLAIRVRPFCPVLLAMAVAIAGLTCSGPLACGQAAQATAVAGAPRMLFIDVLEGEGELNDIRARTAREPVVQVKDENHKPVAGALVVFSIRSAGTQPVSAFSGLPTLSVRTGADGTARATGYRPAHTGNVQIAVAASVGVILAEITIHQTNYFPGGHLRQTLSTHKALAGGIAELAAFAAASSIVIVQAQTSPVIITAGPGNVGASRPGSARR